MVGVDVALAQPWTEHLAQSIEGVRVVTSRDIATLIGLERQRQLLGCTDSNACMAELADALGVNGLLLGDVVKVGTTVQVSVRVVEPLAARRLAAYSTELGHEDRLVVGDGRRRGRDRGARRLRQPDGAPHRECAAAR